MRRVHRCRRGWCGTGSCGVRSVGGARNRRRTVAQARAPPSRVNSVAVRPRRRAPPGTSFEAMWFHDMDIGGRGIVHPAKGPLGRALRHARHAVYLSQQRLADAAGVSQAAVSRLERGAPSWGLFCKLLGVLGGRPLVTVERLRTQRELFDAYLSDEDLCV